MKLLDGLNLKSNTQIMDKADKIRYFQYTLHKLLNWYYEVNGNEQPNNLSILKTLKLLFFVTAAKSSKEDNETLIDNVFTSYAAMPLGHVEKDIYSAIKESNGSFQYFTINNECTSRTAEDISNLIGGLEVVHKLKIDESVDYLKSISKNLINLKAFDLVELSHHWYSWRNNYEKAQKNGIRKWDISPDDIKSETKIYNLQSY